MEGLDTILLSFGTSFIVVLLSMPALITVALMKNLVDKPTEDRKIHTNSTPTIGGILIFAGTLFAYFLWYPFKDIHEYDHLYSAINDFKYIGASMLILFFVGVKDDIVGTAPVKKLAGHLIVAFILVIMADIRIYSMHGLFGVYQLNDWTSIFLSFFTYTVIVNAMNLIDGVDGLSGGVGFITCVVFGTWFYLAGGIENASLSFALAGSLLAFLFFNFNPAKIFMGDSGSLTIGLIISVLSIKLIEFDVSEVPRSVYHISKPVLAMSVLVYPLIDTLRVFVIRAIKGRSPFSADKNHLHHRLLRIGLNHKWTVIVIYLYTLAVTAVPVLANVQASYQLLLALGVAFAFVGILFIIPVKKEA